jgi:hypothetical protein
MDEPEVEILRLKRAIERAKTLNKQLQSQIEELTELLAKSKSERLAEVGSRALAE